MLTMLPVVNVPSPGTYPVQPMYVPERRAPWWRCWPTRAANQTLEIGGLQTFTFNEMMRKTLEASGRRGVLIHMPLPIMRLVVPLPDKVAPALIMQDQFKMLLGTSATRDTGLAEGGGFARGPLVEAMRRGLKAPGDRQQYPAGATCRSEPRDARRYS